MDYFAILSKKVGKENASAKIEEKIERFHGLLTKEASAKLIASEMGLIEKHILKISELNEGMSSVDLLGVIEEIGQIKRFPSGTILRNIRISDDSGECVINFWGEDAKKSASMHLGDVLEIRKGYVKMNRVNLGYRSTYSITKPAMITPLSEINEGKKFSVSGKVEKITGIKGKIFIFSIVDGETEVSVSLINAPKKGEHLQIGDSVLLEGVEYNGAELLIKNHARLLLRKNRKNIFRGNLESIRLEGKKVFIEVGREQFVMSKELLINFLNLKDLREDIDLNVVVGMKLPDVLGHSAFLKFRKIGGEKEIEYAELR